jgi:hypothetical protein
VWVPEQALREVQEGVVLHLPHAMIHGYIGLAQIIHRQPTLTGAIVRLSPKMNDQWWKLNNAFKGGERDILVMLKKYNVKNLILMPNTGLPPDMTVGMDRVLQAVATEHEIKVIDARTPLVSFRGFEKADHNIFNISKIKSDVAVNARGVSFKNVQLIKARQLEIVVVDYEHPYKIEFFKDSVSIGFILIPTRVERGRQYHIIELASEVQGGFNEINIQVDGGGIVSGLNFRE